MREFLDLRAGVRDISLLDTKVMFAGGLKYPAVAERLRLNLPRQWIYACVILGQKGKVRNGYRKKLYV